MAKKLIKWAKETGVSTLAIPAKVGQCRPCVFPVPDIEVHDVGRGPDDPEGKGVEDDEEQEGDERHHHEVS